MSTALLGSLLLGRYRLDALLGAGGAGTVYRGHDTRLGRDVAVKVLSRATFGDETGARLLREARAAAALNHPRIVSVYDAGEDQDVLFIVMELVAGPDLRHRQPLTIAQSLEVGRQLCEALAHAHAHGIVHRDLKPENILVAADGEQLEVKLADLGLAIAHGSSRLTATDAILGTAWYLAPEQALGADVDGRADLYALGAVLYELVAGRLPFEADHPLAVISQHVNAPVVPPRTYRAEVPAELEGLILRLLAKQPEKRPASAGEVGEALARVRPAAAESAAAGAGAASEPVRLLDQLARGRLVGRQPELRELGELWARSQRGHGHLALISGEPGVGKSRLARELEVRAQLDGATVLHGGCYEFEATTPYLPFIEALRLWVASQSPDALRAALGGMAAELARLAPEIEAKLGALPPSVPLTPQEERLRLLDSVARLFQRLAEQRGVLLFLDDLHWADHGSLALLHYLIRNLRDSRLLVLGAYREVELDRSHPLAAALVDWNRERLATRIALGRLSREETGRLLATLFGQEEVTPDFGAVVHQETEGNPFFVEEVIKSLIEQGQIVHRDGEWHRDEVRTLTIPQSVKSAIGRRLDRLSPACTEVLQTAAALGKVFDYAELAAVSGGAEDQLLDALDEAAAAQLVRAEREEAFAFTHDKIREVLHDELNPIRQRRLHQRIGESLERLYASDLTRHVQDLAYHFGESSDTRKGLGYSLAAARRAVELYAHDEALAYYQGARECAEALEDQEQLAAVFEGIGAVHSMRGQLSDAVDGYERAITLLADRPRRAALRARIGELYARVGDPRGLPHLEAALADFDPASQANDVALAIATVGRYHHYHSQPRLALEHLHRARELAEPVDDPFILELIYSYLAGAYQHMTRFAESLVWARRAIELGQRHGFPSAEAGGNEFVAEDCAPLGRWEEGLTAAARDHEIGSRIGSQGRVAWSLYARAQLLLGRGDLAESASAARRSIEVAERIEDRRVATLVRGDLAIAETDLGNLESADALAREALQSAEALQQLTLRGFATWAMAHLLLARREPKAAIEIGVPIIEELEQSENLFNWLLVPAPHGEALIAVGDLDRAAAVLDHAIAVCREAEANHFLAVMLRVKGQELTARGDRVGAERAFQESVQLHESLGTRLELARVLDRRGRARGAAGDVVAGRANLERACELFAACGAAPERDRAARALAETAAV
jgi:tetratricopeptide (TPR) repeat protein